MEGTTLCMVVWPKGARCTTITLEQQTSEGSENEDTPQSVNCPLLAQHQAGETALGWVNRNHHAFMQMLSGASWVDKG